MTKFTDIPHIRLHNQYLSQPEFTDPVDVVRHLGAVQAQEYLGGMWSIGMRMKNATEPDVEKAVEAGTILRTWPMRGTIHFVPAEDAKWMVQLMAGRVNRKMESYYRKVDLTERVFDKASDLLVNRLEKDKAVIRPDIYRMWEESGINTKQTRGLFIIGNLAQKGLICFGPKQGNQPTFVLLDKWAKKHNKLEGEEAIAEMALRYFRSHGPAQLHDFMWWTGLTMTETKSGLELLKGKLVEEEIDGIKYWSTPIDDFKIEKSPKVYLQQPYDEYTVAYKDRSAISSYGNSMMRDDIKFYSIIVLDGQVVGFWKRTLSKDKAKIEIDTFRKLTSEEKSALEVAVKDYGKFIGVDASL